MKTRLAEDRLFHADVRTDMTKLTVAFRNFANAPKIKIWFTRNLRPAYNNTPCNYLQQKIQHRKYQIYSHKTR